MNCLKPPMVDVQCSDLSLALWSVNLTNLCLMLIHRHKPSPAKLIVDIDYLTSLYIYHGLALLMDEMLHKIILIIFVGFLFPFIQQQICDDNSDQQQQRLWSTLFCSDMYLLFRILIHIIQAFLIDGDVHKP